MFSSSRSEHLYEDDNVAREISTNPSALHLCESYTCFTQSLPKVLVLFCGGTLIMHENKDGSLVVNDKETAMDLLLNLEPRLEREVAKLEVKYVDNIDSSNMSSLQWDKIGQIIYDSYAEFDGFVITHGTDTSTIFGDEFFKFLTRYVLYSILYSHALFFLYKTSLFFPLFQVAYTASALSFILGDLGKPVVLTGAQIPAGRIESDARRNFVNAVRVSTLSKAGVFLVFDGDIILGSRSHKLSESKLDAFGPINWGLHGEIRIDILFNEDDTQDRHDRPLQFQPGFESEVAVFTLFPGFPPSSIIRSIESGAKGLILRGYGSGNISYIYLNAIQMAKEREIPVVVTTQCLEGATLMHLYDVGRQALNAGVVQAYDMSDETVITKLMWSLKHADSYHQVCSIMHTNFCGEINKEGKLYGART